MKLIYISPHLKDSPTKCMYVIPEIQCQIVSLMISYLGLSYIDASAGHRANTSVAIFFYLSTLSKNVTRVGCDLNPGFMFFLPRRECCNWNMKWD